MLIIRFSFALLIITNYLQNLRDPDGNHYSPYQYSLQTSADGSILIVPHANSNLTNPERKDTPPQGRKE